MPKSGVQGINLSNIYVEVMKIMKKSIAFLACAILGSSLALSATATNVNAQSVSQGNYAQVTEDTTLYDQNGNETNVGVEKDSKWKVAQTVKINDNNYFQVAPNQFLSAKDSFQYKNRKMVIKVDSSDNDGTVRVYDHNLVQKTDVSIASGTRWCTDTAINTSNAVPFLRIGPDEYVSMVDVTEQQFSATI